MSTTVYVSGDATALALGADRVARAIGGQAGATALTCASCATARAACSGSSRWSKSRRRPGVSPTVRSWRRTSKALFAAGFLNGGAHARKLGNVGEHRLFQEAGTPDVRARRPDRSAQPRRLPRAWRLARPRGVRSNSRRPTSSRSSPIRACAAAAARRFRPASSGRRCSARQVRKSTSSAMPTKAIRARSPIAC